MRLVLLRHGDTGRAGHLDGRSDPPLSAEGWSEMERQLQACDHPLIVTSPRLRCLEPARRHAAATNARLIVDPDWAEMDFGRWDGFSRAEIEAFDGGARILEAFYRDPDGVALPGAEAWTAFGERVSQALDRLVSKEATTGTLVITHAGAMRAALSLALGWPLCHLWSFRIGYATLISIEVGRSADGRLWGEIMEVAQP